MPIATGLTQDADTLPPNARRILILGSPGSGKSTLARRLGPILNLPVVHLDRLFWKPGWVESEHEAFDTRVRQALQEPAWIMDGNYGRTLPWRMKHADAIIYLDMPRFYSLRNVIKRQLNQKPGNRPDMPEGCTERVELAFLKYVWNFRPSHHDRFLKLLHESGKPVVVLTRPSQIEPFLDRQRAAQSERLAM